MSAFYELYSQWGITGVLLLFIIVPLSLNFAFSSAGGKRASTLVLVVLAAAIIACALVYAETFAHDDYLIWENPRITEDSLSWDCVRMGNHICGDSRFTFLHNGIRY